MLDFRSALNPEQYAACTHTGGPLLILAGAGSGKTRVITHRIAYAITEGVARPDQILAVTFTNKAAREMQERVDALLRDAGVTIGIRGGPAIGTFHATCARLLRTYGPRVGLASGFSIYDDADQMAMLKRAAADLLIDDDRSTLSPFRAFIEQSKNDGLTPAQAFERARGRAQEEAAELYARYAARMLEANAVDFGDLILLTLRLLREHPDVAARLQRRWRCVLVDEFQDTNPAQYGFLRLLAATDAPDLTVVGDDDQSIYAWRGATVENILNFQGDFPDATVVKLERNYRSSNTILDAAADLIEHNTRRMDKRLWTERDDGLPVRIYPASSERDEAAFVARTIKRLCLDEDLRFDDVAVFYRINALGRVLEERFRAEGIEHRIVGGTAFFERAEIKDVLAFLTLLVNPADPIARARVINLPPRGLGKKAVATLDRFIDASPDRDPVASLTAIARDDEGGLGKRIRAGVTEFVDLLDALREASQSAPLHGLVDLLLERSAYLEHAEKRNKHRFEDIRDNLAELTSALADFQDTHGEEATLAAFLEHTALVRPEQTPEEAALQRQLGTVHLMSIHSAKGLEFDAVFVIGVEEEILPHSRSESDEHVEEERRLAYVAFTRAREHLFITHARNRRVHGTFRNCEPSRFLRELRSDYLSPVKGSLDAAVGRRPASRPSSKRRRRAPQPPPPEEHFEPIPDDEHYVLDVIPDYESHLTQLAPEYSDHEVVIELDVDTHDDAPPEPPPTGGLSVGDTVTHKRFGVGEVLALERRGQETHARVHFPMGGEKTVVTRFLRRL